MDCQQFDGQVVRLEQIKDVAEQFVRVRLTRIDPLDLNLFEFDYDLTMMIFFLDADTRVYARYGGRDAKDAENRQSLAGLRYTMQSVLSMHEASEKSYAPKRQETARTIRDTPGGNRMGCMHCHNVKEVLEGDLRRKGQWSREQIWRYPLPENLGFELEVDRGNVVKAVREKSVAATAGLQPGDVVRRLHGIPIHSFGDATFALDRAPKDGAVDLSWQRGEQLHHEKLVLPEGWRRTDITWRASLRRLIPSARLTGVDLTPDEKKALGLAPKQLAFRQRDAVTLQARNAGVRAGDIILGVDDKQLDMTIDQFHHHVEANYLIGDQVTVNVLRDGQRLSLPMKLIR